MISHQGLTRVSSGQHQSKADIRAAEFLTQAFVFPSLGFFPTCFFSALWRWRRAAQVCGERKYPTQCLLRARSSILHCDFSPLYQISDLSDCGIYVYFLVFVQSFPDSEVNGFAWRAPSASYFKRCWVRDDPRGFIWLMLQGSLNLIFRTTSLIFVVAVITSCEMRPWWSMNFCLERSLHKDKVREVWQRTKFWLYLAVLMHFHKHNFWKTVILQTLGVL